MKKITLKFLIILIFTCNIITSIHTLSTPKDNINHSSSWKNLKRDRNNNITNEDISSNIKIKLHESYTPEYFDNNGLIVWIVIHNTWDENLNSKKLKLEDYLNIKRLASWYSTVKKTKLEIISIKYKGEFNISGEQILHNFLYKLFTENEKYKNAQAVFLGHGNGCNVISKFTNLKPANLAINLLIYLGCVKQSDISYNPSNYKMLLYFYSDSDRTCLKKIDKRKLRILSSSIFPGIDFLLSKIDFSSLFTSSLLNQIIRNAFKREESFEDYSIAPINTRYDFEPQNSSITVGYRVKIDSINASHNQLISVTQLIPEIIEKSIEDYPIYFFRSDKIHLNIDSENINLNDISNTKNKILLVPFTRLRNIIFPTNIDHLSRNHIEELSQDDNTLRYISTRDIEDNQIRKRRIAQEEYSNRYNDKDIEHNMLMEFITPETRYNKDSLISSYKYLLNQPIDSRIQGYVITQDLKDFISQHIARLESTDI